MQDNPHQHQPSGHQGPDPHAGPAQSRPPQAQSSNQPGAASPAAGRPMQAPLYAEPTPVPAEGPNKMLLCIMAVAVLIAGVGLVHKMIAKPEPKQPVVRAPSPWEQQQQLMREAMDMAREAQQMQREHQDEMRRAMEMEYGGEFSDGEW